MAPKPVDNSVNERRLRPIYDWLDNGNNKKALQEADKVLKKQPTLQCAKALKALAMIRLGRAEEANHILRELHSEEPSEDATLQAMAICYRETHRPELTCQAYEAAVRKEPGNEEFLSYLFMSYVRIGDYRKQQQTAMALFKAKPKNPYYFWAVMSILMQAEEGTSVSVTLPLAERMARKFLDDGKMEAEAEIQLYLMVLEKQGKFKEALEVLEGPLARKFLPDGTLEAKRGDYLKELKLWDRVVDHYEALLRADPDQWSHYVSYVEAVLALSSDEAVMSRAKEFILAEPASQLIRGPFLARLLFWQELDRKGLDAPALLGDFGAFVEDYVRLFGDKPCAFLDLRPFIESLRSPQEIDGLLDCTGRLAGEEEVPKTVKELCRHLLHVQLSRYLGRHEPLSPEEKVQLADRLWLDYERTKFLNAGLLPTDFRSNDGYALMAAHLLLDAWNGEPAMLDKCLVLLETALKASPANYHLKLLATRAYTLAGHGRAALERYETLDVKYIQLDSLGHLLCRPLISMGLPQSASPLLSATLRFYTAHARETAECLISAYKFGSFAKIPEFTRFGRRLDGSFHFAASTAERMLLDLLTEGGNTQAGLVATAAGMHADPRLDQPDWTACVDNRDWAVFVTWDPPSRQMGRKEVVAKTFQGEVAFARLRNRLVHALIAAISSGPDGQLNGTVLSGLLAELADLQKEYEADKDLFIPYSQFSVQSPPPPRLYSYVRDFCLEPLLVLMEQLAGEANLEAVERFRTALTRLVETARRSSEDSAGLWRNYVRLERIYNAVETLCLSALLLSTMTARKKTKGAGQKKKISAGQTDTLKELVQLARESMRDVEALLDELNLSQPFAGLRLDDESSSSPVNLPGSEMKALLTDKRKMLDGCH